MTTLPKGTWAPTPRRPLPPSAPPAAADKSRERRRDLRELVFLGLLWFIFRHHHRHY